MSHTRRPNIVLVITDDQGYGDLGCTGNPWLRTPALDDFYADAVRLRDFHVGPTCAPTRAGLLTGHYANSTGVWHTIGGRSLLREGEVTLADTLRAAGYRTAIFGKWHLGDNPPYRPGDRGFDECVTHGGGGIGQTPDAWGNDYFDDVYSVNGQPRRFAGYCTDVWFAEARAFLTRMATTRQPFFCYLAPNAPHSPFNVPPPYAAPYRSLMSARRANFYGMIANLDENFARLRATLRELALEEDTILIFMTDNGTAAGARFDAAGFLREGYNAGLRGGKGSPYDGGHRVPFFLRYPRGALCGGRDINTLCAHIDVMPTLLELCNVPTPRALSWHGRSLVPILRDAAAAWPERTLVTDSQRLTEPVKWRQSAVMSDRWRLIDGAKLYDIRADREQRRDLAAQHPTEVARLRAAYEEWWAIVSEQAARNVPIALGAETVTTLSAHDWRNEASDCPWHQGHIRAGHRSEGYWEVRVLRAGRYQFALRRWPEDAGRCEGHPLLTASCGCEVPARAAKGRLALLTASYGCEVPARAAKGRLALTAGIDGDDVPWRAEWIAPEWHHWYRGGAALPIRSAELELRAEIGEGRPANFLRPRSAGTRWWGSRRRQQLVPGAEEARFRLRLPVGDYRLSARFCGEGGLRVGAYYVRVEWLGE